MLKRIFTILLGLLLLFSLAGCQAPKKQADTPTEEDSPPRIYWNMDRLIYYDPETRLSTRQPEKDGLFHIRFVLDGEQVELTCADQELVHKIDSTETMALRLDKQQRIIRVDSTFDLRMEFPGYYFVEKIDGNRICVHCSKVLGGAPYELELNENTRIYDVTSTAEVCGMPAKLHPLDWLLVLQTGKKGTVTHIFITDRSPKVSSFWRVDAVYGQPTWDEENQCTTRVPDKNGVYTIPMALDGQQVDVLCKDIEIVNKIDSLLIGEQAIGLQLDSDGFAVYWAAAARAIPGYAPCNQWDVTKIEGNEVTTTCNLPVPEKGAVATRPLAADCRIYDTTGSSGPVGVQVDSLQLGDRVMLLCNADGEIVIAYITQRLAQ